MCETDRLTQAAYGVGYSSLKRYRAKAKFLFNGVQLVGKRVIDVGCGRGAFSLWTAFHGASYVKGLEPEGQGSTFGTLSTFQSLIASLGFSDKVEVFDLCLEELSAGPNFDIIIMYNVINHLDEDAVIHLHNDNKAWLRYLAIARHLRGLLHAKGWLILADCGRRNFWRTLGIPSPMAPSIDWEKHQEPPVWIELFTQAGFRLHDWRWSPIYPFGSLSTNLLFQYLTSIM